MVLNLIQPIESVKNLKEYRAMKLLIPVNDIIETSKHHPHLPTALVNFATRRLQ